MSIVSWTEYGTAEFTFSEGFEGDFLLRIVEDIGVTRTVVHMQISHDEDRGVHTVQSGNDGPHVVVLGGIHGNEPAGVAAMSMFLHELQQGSCTLTRGSLSLIVGNPNALEVNKRYLDKDLNRCFVETHGQPATTREERRAAEIMPYLQDANYVMDLHSASSPTDPFAMCDTSLCSQALDIGFATVVTGWEHLQGVSGDTETYAFQQGASAFTVEAGQHSGAETAMNAHGHLCRLLQFLEMIPGTAESAESQVYALFDIVQKQSDVTYTLQGEGFTNFDSLQKDQVILESSEGPLLAPKDCHIIFPTDPSTVPEGGDLYFLAEKR